MLYHLLKFRNRSKYGFSSHYAADSQTRLGKAALEQTLALNSQTLVLLAVKAINSLGLVMFRSRSEKNIFLLLHYAARTFMEVNNLAVKTTLLFVATLHWFHGTHYSAWLLLPPIAQEWQCVGSCYCVLCLTPLLVLWEPAGAQKAKMRVQAIQLIPALAPSVQNCHPIPCCLSKVGQCFLVFHPRGT